MEFTGERLIPKINQGSQFYYEHLLRYLFACQFAKNKQVLDVACGAGYGTKLLATKGQAKKVIGIDLSKETIDYAQKNYSVPQTQFMVSNVLTMDKIKNQSIDLIVAFEIIEHIKDQQKFIKELKRVLAPKGLVIISTPNKSNYPPGNPFHVKELTLDAFKKLLNDNFESVDILAQTFEFSQNFIPAKKEVQINDQAFMQTEELVFNKTQPQENGQFFIALCQNQTSQKQYKPISIHINKVDQYDMQEGFYSLSKLQKQINKQQKAIESKQIIIEQKENYIVEQREALARLEEHLNSKDATIIRQRDRLKEKNKSIKEQGTVITSLEKQLKEIRSLKVMRAWQTYRAIMGKPKNE